MLTKIFLLGIIVLAVGLAILFPSLVSYAIWQRDYERAKAILEEWHAAGKPCGDFTCSPPAGIQTFDNAVTWGIIISSVIIAGGVSAVIHGIKYEI